MKNHTSNNTVCPQKDNNKQAKKTLIIIILIIVAVIAVLGAVALLIDLYEKEEEYVIDYDFYPIDFEEDIFEDEEYLSLIDGGFITYTDSMTNVSVGITKDNAYQYGEEVKFLVDMIYDIINGDHQAYNARFSNNYYNKNSPKEAFTMQKIYDVKITYVMAEITSKDGENNAQAVYHVDYRIYHNNGSFRRDIGDGSRTQRITLTKSENGTILIDKLAMNIPKK